MGVQTRLHIKQAGRAAVCRPTLSRVLRSFDRGKRCQRERDRSQHATVEEMLGPCCVFRAGMAAAESEHRITFARRELESLEASF